ncbi:HAMP domain-containing protein [Planctomycetales bacterium ZRK34]|nr:HAMP domain-containing protein [Planctomycetales bacterium ZRK34]
MMLRRKLMLILGALSLMLILVAVAALWSLQGVFRGLDHLCTQSTAMIVQSGELNQHISAIEVELYRIQTGREYYLDELIHHMQVVQSLAADVGLDPVMHEPEIEATYHQFHDRLKTFTRHVGALATAQDPQLASRHNLEALATAAAVRDDANKIVDYAHRHVRQEQIDLTGYFRWLIIGMAIGFLLVIDVSVLMLLRSAEMVLEPVDKLVAASRELAKENFQHRVEVDNDDEFAVLASAYNKLAEQLQGNEQRRVEVLQQAALTLNHELNNAMTVIELELTLLRRRRLDPEASEKCLLEIHQNLKRMAGVVESLKHVRRIVLRDYDKVTKMLDLERSVEPEVPTIAIVSQQPQSHRAERS